MLLRGHGSEYSFKVFIAAPIVIILSFFMGWTVRKLPGFRTVFS